MRRYTLLELLVTVALVGLLASFGATSPAKKQVVARRTACGNNLRALAVAAIQYADDKRFFPHVGPGSGG